ncbi:MAG TPA: cation:proton antiporter, partial [Acidimicrobiales bacterium]|nr:cation:proton antiporter [Acidimicrobiales bacterium]
EPLAGSELTGRILLAVAVVILASRAVGYLFSRIRQPRVVGEIVAGILLGPSLLGLILPEVTGYLFPPEVVTILGVVAQFGLIFFMFLIGLELDLTLVARSGHVALLVSHTSIVFPFALGLAASLVVYPLLGNGDFVGFALFLGAAMAITAFPVLARILTDTGLHRTRLGALAITCAAIDDVTAWCLLAVVVAVVKSSGALDVVATIGLSLVFVAGMILVVRPLLARLARSSGTWSRLHPPVMAALFAGLFLAAWATEEIGIHAIFGAFLLGAVMPRSQGLVAKVAERIEDVTVLFLLPVFFVVVGLSTRIGLLDQAVLWEVAVLILVVAVVGKWAGSMLAARACGQGWRDATALGALMNTRGLTEIVILTIGASLGVVSPALFTIMVVMALVTTLMATPLLSVIYPRRLIDRESGPSAERHRAGDRFDHRVLVGVGSPERASPLLALARDLCRAPGQRGEALLAHVAPPSGREEVRANLASLDAAATAALVEMGPLATTLLQAGVDTRLRASVGTEVARELRRLAVEEGADLILLGWHGAYARRGELTGVVADVLAEAPCPVAVLLDHRGRADDAAPVAVWWSRRPGRGGRAARRRD